MSSPTPILLQADAIRVALFIASGVALAAGYLACRAIVRSKLGKVAVAVRDAEDRTRFIGYKVEHVKLWVFTFSAILAGIAGALYVPQVGIINPSEFSPLNSIEMVVWVAVGGRATLYGAVVGAVLVNYGTRGTRGEWGQVLKPSIWGARGQASHRCIVTHRNGLARTAGGSGASMPTSPFRLL